MRTNGKNLRNERGWKALLSTVAKSTPKGFLGISPLDFETEMEPFKTKKQKSKNNEI